MRLFYRTVIVSAMIIMMGCGGSKLPLLKDGSLLKYNAFPCSGNCQTFNIDVLPSGLGHLSQFANGQKVFDKSFNLNDNQLAALMKLQKSLVVPAQSNEMVTDMGVQEIVFKQDGKERRLKSQDSDQEPFISLRHILSQNEVIRSFFDSGQRDQYSASRSVKAKLEAVQLIVQLAEGEAFEKFAEACLPLAIVKREKLSEGVFLVELDQEISRAQLEELDANECVAAIERNRMVRKRGL